MTDRRSRAPMRCQEPGCVHVGAWQASRGLCPVHYAELTEYLAAVIRRRQHPEPDEPGTVGPPL